MQLILFCALKDLLTCLRELPQLHANSDYKLVVLLMGCRVWWWRWFDGLRQHHAGLAA